MKKRKSLTLFGAFTLLVINTIMMSFSGWTYLVYAEETQPPAVENEETVQNPDPIPVPDPTPKPDQTPEPAQGPDTSTKPEPKPEQNPVPIPEPGIGNQKPVQNTTPLPTVGTGQQTNVNTKSNHVSEGTSSISTNRSSSDEQKNEEISIVDVPSVEKSDDESGNIISVSDLNMEKTPEKSTVLEDAKKNYNDSPFESERKIFSVFAIIASGGMLAYWSRKVISVR